MKTMTHKKLARTVCRIMAERAQRINTLRRSTIRPEGELDVANEAVAALRILEQNPRRILDWITEEELALFSTLEEI